jgi:hypothetical protein
MPFARIRTIEDSHHLAAERDGYCLSTEYSPKGKMNWMCHDGHTWWATYGNIRAGRWCPDCAGVRKRDLDYANRLAAEHDGYCLSTEYINNEVDMDWKCRRGHEWTAPLHRIVHGSWCRDCFIIEQRYTINEAKELAAQHDGYCLSDEYTKSSDDLRWKCHVGHEWPASFNRVSKGQWCRECYDNDCRECQTDKLNELMAKKGAVLLSNYINTRTPVSIKCINGHTFDKEPRYLFARSWCPDCAPKTERMGYGRKSLITMEYITGLAAEHDGYCLSTEFETTKEDLTWKCFRGHIWDMTLGQVKLGHWCHECTIINRRIKGMNRALGLIDEMGGSFVSGEYINVKSPLRVKCADGHEWTTHCGMLNNKNWCPDCAKAGKGVRDKLKPILASLYPNHIIHINQRNIPWLIGPGGGRMEIDFLITTPIQTIAIEYDGKQHFEVVDWSGDKVVAQKEFEQVQQRDLLKNQLIAAHPEDIQHFLRIPYTIPITLESILEYLESNQVPVYNTLTTTKETK